MKCTEADDGQDLNLKAGYVQTELKIEFKTENGIKVFIYPAMWARGVDPQKNIRVKTITYLK